MCGRYTLHDQSALRAALLRLGLAWPPDMEMRPRFNAAPTQAMPVVLHRESAPAPTIEPMQWGSQWLDDEERVQISINARSEKAAFTRFQPAVEKRRCLVPANGFFEWDRSVKPAAPFLFEATDQPLFWMAAAWDDTTDEFLEGFFVLTTKPNDLVARVHDRMPAILDDESARAWLSPGPLSGSQIRELCGTYPAERMRMTSVSTAVNSVRNDNAACLTPTVA